MVDSLGIEPSGMRDPVSVADTRPGPPPMMDGMGIEPTCFEPNLVDLRALESLNLSADQGPDQRFHWKEQPLAGMGTFTHYARYRSNLAALAGAAPALSGIFGTTRAILSILRSRHTEFTAQ